MFPVSNCIFLTEYPCLLPKEFVAWVGYRVSSLDILEKMHGHCLGFCLHKHAIAWLFVYQDPKRVHSMLQSTNLLWTPLNTWFMCRLPPSKTTMSIKIASRHAHRPITMFIILWVALHCWRYFAQKRSINLWNSGRNGCHGARACCEEVASWKTRDGTIDGSVFPAKTVKGVVPKTAHNIKL